MKRRGIKPSTRAFWRAVRREGLVAAFVAAAVVLGASVMYLAACWMLWQVHGVWQWDPALWPELIQGSGQI